MSSILLDEVKSVEENFSSCKIQEIRSKGIPRHIAIIMDGNRRWAKEHRLPAFEGHRRGEERIEPIIDKAIELGIKYLTFWAFSI